MKKYLIIITAVFFAGSLNAQQVTNNAGGIFQNSQYELSWGLGELAIHTLTSDEYILTQGFQQSLLTVTGIGEDKPLDFDISVFPNPTQDFVNLEVEKKGTEKLEYHLFGQKGELIERNAIHSPSVKVPFLNQPNGIYYLNIYSNDKKVKTFKIVKE